MTWDQTNLQYFQRAGKVTVTQVERALVYSLLRMLELRNKQMSDVNWLENTSNFICY